MKSLETLKHLKCFEIIILIILINICFGCTTPEQFEKYQIIPDILDRAPLYKAEVNIKHFKNVDHCQ